MTGKIDVITFDADDTLWVNETYFQDTRAKFAKLIEQYISPEKVAEELFVTEMQDLPYYGYGAKAFTLSMIETAVRVSENRIDPKVITKIIALGKEIISHPIELLGNIEEVLKQLSGKYKLALATKGDLLDQRRKLLKSGIAHYFDHIEIMSDKKQEDYSMLINKLGCKADKFLMVGNSVKSDILPVLGIGGYAVHIPFTVTWEHEIIEDEIVHPNFRKMDNAHQLLEFLSDN